MAARIKTSLRIRIECQERQWHHQLVHGKDPATTDSIAERVEYLGWWQQQPLVHLVALVDLRRLGRRNDGMEE